MEMSAVSDSLTLSMRAHKTAHAVRNGKATGDNQALLAEAKLRRTQAHDLDPNHSDSAWQTEQLPPLGYPGIHERLLAFYESHLS